MKKSNVRQQEKKAYEVKNVKSNNFNFLIIPSENEDLSVSLLIGKKIFILWFGVRILLATSLLCILAFLVM
uniref:Uncharacterized protein n=1 Tax=Nelumbo nucifera TaxID=4432 RepID=A0A822ZZU9_NELNU|nr:TPA_asm: hypothetical protein HUJ06_018556 [Nelumbo nucifera]